MAGKAKKSPKEAKINREKKRIRALFEGVDEKKRDVVDGLIDEAAFMRIELSELREYIVSHGVTDEMCQGQYTITRESPQSRAYNSMLQRYTTVTDKLSSMLPKDTTGVVDDGFEDFIADRD